MTTASRPLATALWGARFAGVWLPFCYTTWGDTTLPKPDISCARDTRLAWMEKCYYVKQSEIGRGR